MRIVTVGLHLLLLLLFLHPVTSADSDDPQEENKDNPHLDVFVHVSPCSVTCGLGIKTETLCSVKNAKHVKPKDGKTIQIGTKDGVKWVVSEDCHVRKVKCLETVQCGLSTMTVTSGQRVELNCLGEITKELGMFSWRVTWRFARGVISSDDSLFSRWDAPQLDNVILDPIREENAGTYRCVVQDASFRRVKRIYWGIRVLPEDFLNLDYESSQAQWNSTGDQQQDETTPDQYDVWVTFLMMVVIGLSVAVVGTGLYWMVKRRKFDRFIPHKLSKLQCRKIWHHRTKIP